MNRREMVQQEIEEYKKRFGDNWKANYFNNWYLYFSGYYRKLLESHYSRPDEKRGKFPIRLDLSTEEQNGDLKCNQTMREFYKTIGDVLQEE